MAVRVQGVSCIRHEISVAHDSTAMNAGFSAAYATVRPWDKV